MAKRSVKLPIKTLLLIDHDGTLCDTNPMAYDSIKYAFRMANDTLKIATLNEIEWDKIFTETRGTTEKNLIRHLCYSCGIPFIKTEQFEEKFYHFRAKWYENMRTSHEYIWDTYYPDAHQLVYKCSMDKSYALWILTGNPKQVLKERLSNSMRDIFSNNLHDIQGVFGDEEYTRRGLIEKALHKAKNEIKDFILDKDDAGFTKNVIYIADSRSDFFAGIEAKVRTIWVPSRMLQTVIETKSQDYVQYITNILKERVFIVNDLYSEEVLKFVGLTT